VNTQLAEHPMLCSSDIALGIDKCSVEVEDDVLDHAIMVLRSQNPEIRIAG
jgi:hypothetical protein